MFAFCPFARTLGTAPVTKGFLASHEQTFPPPYRQLYKCLTDETAKSVTFHGTPLLSIIGLRMEEHKYIYKKTFHLDLYLFFDI